MTRDEAYQLLTKYMQNKNLLKHSLAAEAIHLLVREIDRFPEVIDSYPEGTEPHDRVGDLLG